MQIQWYPGHMAKAKRNIREDLKLVDLVIEILDCRCPESSRNPDIDNFAKDKARILLLNKADLADRTVTKKFSDYFSQKGFYTLEIDARNKGSLKKLNALIDTACQPIVEKNLKFIELTRYSNRQKTKMQLGGIIGEMKIVNLNKECYEVLKLGEILGVGKSCAFGLGKIVVESSDE